VAHDRLDYNQVRQCLQEFVFNTNIPTRVGFQTPFTNITLDLMVPSHLAGEKVIIGGKEKKATYAEFQKEMDMINHAFCEVMMAGDAKGRIFTFPIPTYNITHDFDWENHELDALWKMTSRYGVPYFSNFVNSEMQPSDARSMCCRLRLDNRELWRRGGGLFGANPKTGSIGVVTLNMPRIGYESKTEDAWFGRIEYLMNMAKQSLELKRKALEKFTEEGLYPYSKNYLTNVLECQKSYWANHFSTIGLIGMNEALINFLGRDIASPEGKALSLRTLRFMKKKLSDFQEESGNLYNLEATPGEGTTYRLAKIDKGKYSNIYTQGEKDPYYTNSTHLPVGYTDDLFWALKHQDELQTEYTGGTVFHGYLGEKLDDIDTARLLVKRITHMFKLPYFTFTPTFTICPVHGYIPGEHFSCPYD